MRPATRRAAASPVHEDGDSFRIDMGEVGVDEVGQRVMDIVYQRLGLPDRDRVTRKTACRNNDDLDHVELVMALEEEFGIAIPDGEAERMRTVGDLIDFIERHRR